MVDHEARALALRVVGGLATAAATTVTGNEFAGALVGPSVEQALSVFVETVRTRERARAETFCSTASTTLGLTIEDLVLMASRDEFTQEAFLFALGAATSSTDRRKVESLARAYAQLVSDGAARADEGLLVLRCLAELEPVHVSVLDLVARTPATQQAIEVGWCLDDAGPILATLTRLGAIEGNGVTSLQDNVTGAFHRLRRSPLGTTDIPLGLVSSGDERWAATKFGRSCLQSIGAVPDTDRQGESTVSILVPGYAEILVGEQPSRCIAVGLSDGTVLYQAKYHASREEAAKAAGADAGSAPGWWTTYNGDVYDLYERPPNE